MAIEVEFTLLNSLIRNQFNLAYWPWARVNEKVNRQIIKLAPVLPTANTLNAIKVFWMIGLLKWKNKTCSGRKPGIWIETALLCGVAWLHRGDE